MLNREDLIAIFPRPKGGAAQAAWDGYAAALTSPAGGALLARYEITTPLRLAHLLATFGAETNLALVWESGAYSADGIVRVFGRGRHSAAISAAEAQRIAALPVSERTRVLFERVYGAGNPKKAKELGNTEPGDGWRFRGLGLNQMTGRFAHQKAAVAIGCTLDDLALPLNCLHMALIEWRAKDCNRYADADDPVSVRKLINGGSLRISLSRINGLSEARAALARAKRVIGPEDFAVASAGGGAPPTIWHSTEVQTGLLTASGGTATTYNGTQKAVMTLASTGSITGRSLIIALLAEPLVWAGMAAVFGGLYMAGKRVLRYYTEGT